VHPGDEVVTEIGGIGRLVNTIAEDDAPSTTIQRTSP
jgi:hypothetical protein